MPDGFGEPSILFKIVPAFIAAAAFFILVSIIYRLFRKNKGGGNCCSFMGVDVHQDIFPGQEKSKKADMKCPNCNAENKDGTDVSPNGDIKCEYCESWFNVWR